MIPGTRDPLGEPREHRDDDDDAEEHPGGTVGRDELHLDLGDC